MISRSALSKPEEQTDLGKTLTTHGDKMPNRFLLTMRSLSVTLEVHFKANQEQQITSLLSPKKRKRRLIWAKKSRVKISPGIRGTSRREKRPIFREHSNYL